MNIAIIGCGYVGTAMARYWHRNFGFTLTLTTTTPQKISILETIAKPVILVKGNDREGIKSVVANQDIILLTVGASNRNSYEDTYLQTAQNLVSILKQSPTVKQLIYTSSYSVYGDRDGAWVDEHSTLKPVTTNGEILAKTEDLLLSASSGDCKVCILRLGGIYGLGRELVKIFGNYAGTTRPGSGEDITNWIHLEDIVGAIEFVRSHQLEGIYNLVDDAHLSSKELLDRLFERHHLPNVSWDASASQLRPYNAQVSNQKIKEAGYQLIHPEMIF